MSQLVFQVLFLASAGMTLSFGFVKHQEVGRKYFLIHGLIAAATALTGFLFLGLRGLGIDTGIWFGLFVATLVLFSTLSQKWKRTLTAAYFLSLLGALGTLLLHTQLNALDEHFLYYVMNAALSTAVLGFTLAGLMLGHWYLTQPKMAIEELKRITLLMSFAIALRFLYGTYFAAVFLSPFTEAEAMKYLLTNTAGIFLMMRYLWGLFLPMVLCFFIWQTVKIRSTQSATGMLYVQALFIITGEILSLYLAQFHHLYL